MTVAAVDSRSRKLAEGLAEACVRTAVSAGPSALAREMASLAPELAFREVLARGGWYRLGGVVDSAGNRVASNLEQWAARELASHGEDLHTLLDAYVGSDLHSTRLTGKTHYWIAPTGPGAADFMQVEIEELQEVVCQPLFGDEEMPGSIEEFIDARQSCAGRPTPLGSPFYCLRRVIDAAEFLSRMRAQRPEAQPVHRFIEAWEKSSAGNAASCERETMRASR